MIPRISVAAYLGFSLFLYYQRLHLRDFRGGSAKAASALAMSTTIATLVGIGYLLASAWYVAWWMPLFLIALGIITVPLVGAILERAVGQFVISMAGFVGLPVCGVLMSWAIPR